ncbi:hypothetical protein [Saccharicrinis sp. GN24d3]|uniref:hypothetical protein n=1 Tax=Saccharicrinis sp. GN24d3 TaxID=3458416 RepID=UPI0040358494
MKTSLNSFKYIELISFLLFSILVFSAYNTRQNIELYVSVEGNDHATGAISNPFATIPKAVEAVRELREKGNHKPATIYLRAGQHQLTQTLVLGVEDGLSSGAEKVIPEETGAGQLVQSYLKFAAYPGEEPLVSS